MKRLTLIALLVLVAAGCSSSSASAPPGTKYPSLQAMVDRLGCTDLQAEDLSPTATNVISFGPEMRSEGGQCTYKTKTAKLALFKDSKHLQQYLTMAKTVGCAMAKGFGITEVHSAVGPNWTANPSDNLDQAGAADLAKALGGSESTLNCK